MTKMLGGERVVQMLEAEGVDTVFGIIDAFQALGLSGSTSMRTVGPGIANALFATALGLFAAIPAAVFYNYFGNSIKVMGTRMEDFSLEFLNAAERMFEG